MQEQLNSLKSTTIAFHYDDAPRLVDVQEVKECKNGKKILVGKDHDRNMSYRSFDLTRITQLIPIVA